MARSLAYLRLIARPRYAAEERRRRASSLKFAAAGDRHLRPAGQRVMGGLTAMDEGGGDDLVTPGELLGDSGRLVAGRGAYLAPDGRRIYASLTGRRSFVLPPPGSTDKRAMVEVVGHKAHGTVPKPGSVVIGRVTKVMARMASVDIMCVDSKSVKEKFTGIIRQQDVRASEIDKVDIYRSFRPGDIVRALVLSLGDARAYYLSTAKNELGVVSAQSIAGATMVPISWTEMECPLTGQVERRKVAKVN